MRLYYCLDLAPSEQDLFLSMVIDLDGEWRSLRKRVSLKEG